MNALNLAASIREAKQQIEIDYANGDISETERDWRLKHIMGF